MSAGMVDTNTLKWVKSEIDETLHQAQTSLEAYVEDTADESQMRFCINYLHQVHGTLQMVELYGAALAIEEMEKLAQAIFDGNVSNKDDAYETLMRGILQVPDYLEHLMAGNPDMPVVLLPLLNDIRAARNEALLSEGSLFSPDLTVNAPTANKNAEAVDGGLPELARKLRHNYHLGLLEWFKNKDSNAGLQKITDVIGELKNAAVTDEARRVLWIANGLAESLKDNGLDTSVAVKMLMGQVDRQIKRIIDQGESVLDESPPEELEKNLLYYVASSNTAGEVTREIKEAFNLKAVMPDTQALEQARADMSAPNAALMDTVSTVIIEDINRIKDKLDVYVRAEEKDMSVIEEVHAALVQMSDTLAMLSLGVQREAVSKQAELLKGIIDGNLNADEKELMNVAAAMIAVESSLSEISTARVASSIKVAEGVDAGDAAMQQLQGAEQQKLMQSVLDEAKVDLAKIKDALTEFSRDNENLQAIESIPALLEQIQGSLQILSLNDAARLLTLTNQYISNKLIKEKITPSFDDMNNLADAISSLEYYMESLMGSWGQPEAILNVAEQSLNALGVNSDTADSDANVDSNIDTSVDTSIDVAAAPDIDVENAADNSGELDFSMADEKIEVDDSLQVLDESPMEDIDDLLSELELETTDDTEANSTVVTETSLEFDAETNTGMGLDENISLDELSLDFSDETDDSNQISVEGLSEDDSAEEISLDGFSLEMDDENSSEALNLNESSGDLSFELDENSIELDESLNLSESDSQNESGSNSGLDFGNDSGDELSLDFDSGENELDEISLNDIELDESSLDDVSMNFETNEEDENIISDSVKKNSTSNEPSLLDDTIDDEIIEIFLEEADESYESISRLLPMWVANRTDEESLKEIRRAYHTLKGSGRLVGALDVGEFAWAYENMLNRVLEHTITVSPELLEVMERGKKALPELFELFKQNTKPEQHILVLMQYVDELSQGNSITIDNQITPDNENDISEASKTVAEDSVFEIALEEPVSVEATPPIDIDPVLLDIYRKEIDTHVDTLKKYIVDWNNGAHEPSQVLLRALHTITGSSRTTGVQSLASVCSTFEHYVKHLQDYEYQFPLLGLDELEATIVLIENTIDCLDTPEAVLPEHENLLARIHALPQEFSAAPIAPQITEPEAAASEMPDYDEELMEIFLEEGIEILEESDHTIQDWTANPDNQDLVEALQRQLHTLKGGARMAGIAELGDLGHNLESLLTAVVDGHMKASKPMLNLVQRAQDRLVKMLEQVEQHKPLAPATELNQEIALMLKNRGAVADELDVEDIAQPEVEEFAPIEDFTEVEVEDTTNEISGMDDLSFAVEEPELPELKGDISSELFDTQALSPDKGISKPTTDISGPELISENLVPQEKQNLKPVDDEKDRRKSNRVQGEQVRVRAELLDNLVNFAGEVSIYRSRLEQQTNNFRYNITEFDDTVNRLRGQLRQFEIETEAQIEYRHEETLSTAQEDFDPLEMDRFTTMQHLSRAMMESLGDLDSLRGILNNLTRESETLLLQQSRVNTDLQEGLMRTRMVSFSGQAARLRRIVRQTCGELGKHTELELNGIELEIDRTVLERIIPPIEHMLRNAVAHGIEAPAQRKKAGKVETGMIDFNIARVGSEIVIKIKDDGAGINLDAIRKKAISRGIIKADTAATKEMLLDMIMQSGFSTAETVNQIAGRGVGMDVVNTEIKQLGGVFSIDTVPNRGTTFTVTLPMTLAITRALMVMIGEDTYAVPLLSVEGVERISALKVKEILAQKKKVYEWSGEEFNFMHLGSVMGVNEMLLQDDTQQLPMLMVRSGEYRAAILVDSLLGSREIVVKPVGPQLSTLRGISGATIMGDGSVVLIIDLAMLIRLSFTATGKSTEYTAPVIVDSISEKDLAQLVMVVDDSITVRKVTTRLLERNGMRVVSAKDGVDALAQLQETVPDIMLLDVEMPRMDGFELATNMRNDPRLSDIPIIMITSRTGQKHRDRAAAIGVNIYMGKPFTENDLMENINALTVDNV